METKQGECWKCNGTGRVGFTFKNGQCFACNGTGTATTPRRAPKTNRDLLAQIEAHERELARQDAEALEAWDADEADLLLEEYYRSTRRGGTATRCTTDARYAYRQSRGR